MVSAVLQLSSINKLILDEHLSLPQVRTKVGVSQDSSAKRYRLEDRHDGHPFRSDGNSNTARSSMKPDVNRLPIDEHKQTILDAILENDVVIITSNTGSGKTTRVPQFILDHQQCLHQPCRIIVTEPRRLAATMAASHVAKERFDQNSWSEHGCVGYAVKDDMCLPAAWHSITYVTEQKFLNVFHDGWVTHIILDEVHERSLCIDTLLMLCKQAVLTRNQRPKIIIMSASIDVDSLLNYFDSVPWTMPNADSSKIQPIKTMHVSDASRRYQIQQLFLDDIPGLQHTLGEAPATSVLAAVRYLLARYTSGDLLIFVTSVKDVEDCVKALSVIQEVLVCALHAHVSHQESRRAQKTYFYQRKVIVATNIAETSLTINGVSIVLDYAHERFPPLLKPELISKASQIQRKGRAGRNADGVCLTMITQKCFETLSDFRKPESHRLPLHKLVLFALAKGYCADTDALPHFIENLPDPPVNYVLQTILNELSVLDLVVNDNFTALGQCVERLPFDINTSVALMTGAFCNVSHQLSLVLAVARNHVFMRHFLNLPAANTYCELPWGSEKMLKSDIYAAAAFLEWCIEDRPPCNFNQTVLQEVISDVKELRRIGLELGDPATKEIQSKWLEKTIPLVDFAFSSGYRLNILLPTQKKEYVQKGANHYAKLDRNSLCKDSKGQVFFFTLCGAHWFSGIHPASSLSLLTFGGRHVNRVAGGIVLDGSIFMPSDELQNEKMLTMREVFSGLLSDFIENRHLLRIESHRFKNILAHGNDIMVSACRHNECATRAVSADLDVSRHIPVAPRVSPASHCAPVVGMPVRSASRVTLTY